MVLPAQFQLGLELTNIVNPLSQAVSALGSLALVDAIKKSGSDTITEMKLASLIGKHRIDDVIKFHFRVLVAKADQSVISRYMDIVLESGSGPTVQEAMKNPALFSMVIQLSGLAFAHEDESLAFAMVEAIDRIVRESGGDTGDVPDYVSLLGTLRACQQQTAAFQWTSLYEAVELKIQSELRVQGRGESRYHNKRGTKRRKVDKQLVFNPVSASTRHLPFPVLQGLVMWLHSLQRFPEHRFLHLRCDTGISTVVVWCHHILGLSVTVSIHGCEIFFGDGSCNILVEETDSHLASSTLMDPADQTEPLFVLAEDETSPIISFESRARASGYGRKVLQQAKLTEEDIKYCSHWVIAQSLFMSRAYLDSDQSGEAKINDLLKTEELLELVDLSKNRLVGAGQFLFALDRVDSEAIGSCYGKTPKLSPKINWPNLLAILFTFARIQEDDLEECSTMALSLKIARSMQEYDHGIKRRFSSNDTSPPDLVTSFNIMARLLVGHVYSDAYVKPAVLVSAWGWSIFFDSVDSIDPEDVSTDSMRVMRGVPSRSGIRKMRIIDGPTELRRSSTKGVVLNKSPRINYFPGVSTAKKLRPQIGQHFDAFQITQNFNWIYMDGVDKIHKLGFREMVELCMKASRLPACRCDTDNSRFRIWMSEFRANDEGSTLPFRIIAHKELKYLFTLHWATTTANVDFSPERVFVAEPEDKERETDYVRIQNIRWPVTAQRTWGPKAAVPPRLGKVWVFYISDNPAARWLQLDDMCNSCEDGAFEVILRNSHTCLECASAHLLGRTPKPVLLLL